MGALGRKAVWGAALALLVMIPAASAAAANGSGKLDKVLREAGANVQRVIVRYREDAKRDDVKRRIEQHRGRVVSEHRLIPAMSAMICAADIADLAADSGILSVSMDVEVRASASARPKNRSTSSTALANDNDYGTASTLKQALGLQDWFTGSGMTVAIIDSGIQDSIDFK